MVYIRCTVAADILLVSVNHGEAYESSFVLSVGDGWCVGGSPCSHVAYFQVGILVVGYGFSRGPMKNPKITEFGDYATWVTFDIMADYQVRLVITNDLNKSAEARLGSNPPAHGDGFVFNVKGEGRSYIFLQHDSTEGTIAHECWHIVFRIMDWCGAGLDNEVVAYHLDHMVEKVYEFKNAIKSSTRKKPNGKRKRRTSTKKPG
jgi:hypothetical protein